MAKIILIEPDLLLAQSYTTALNHSGHKVTVTTSAQGAINASDEVGPDIIIMELQLANHNGIEFLYEFRSYPEWQKTPVIILSMVPPSEFRGSSVLEQDLSVTTYLYKPQTTLKHIIESVEALVTEPV